MNAVILVLFSCGRRKFIRLADEEFQKIFRKIAASKNKTNDFMKKTLRNLACGAILLTAFACGKNDPDPTPEPTPEPEPEPTPEIVAENLSKDGTSNCYLITKEGDYSFDATVRGNGATTAGLAAPQKVAADSAALVWETSKGMVTGVKFEDGKIIFKVAAQNGNALIAAYSGDKIVWSWHIWFPEDEVATAQTKTGYYVMNMNLGAMTASFGSTPDVKPYGLLYQWGRKDPFPAAPTLTGDTQTVGAPIYGPDGTEVTISYSLWSSVDKNTLDYAIENPTKCLSNYAQYNTCHDWLKASDSDDALWGNPKGGEKDSENNYVNKGAKSFYDPCPVGYRVPPADVFRSFTATGGYTQDPSDFDVVDTNGDGVINAEDFNYGWNFEMKDGSLFFPAAARYDGSYAQLMGSKSGLWGSYWGNSPAKSYGTVTGFAFCVLSFDTVVSASATASASRADAYSVRCIRE